MWYHIRLATRRALEERHGIHHIAVSHQVLPLCVHLQREGPPTTGGQPSGVGEGAHQGKHTLDAWKHQCITRTVHVTYFLLARVCPSSSAEVHASAAAHSDSPRADTSTHAPTGLSVCMHVWGIPADKGNDALH